MIVDIDCLTEAASFEDDELLSRYCDTDYLDSVPPLMSERLRTRTSSTAAFGFMPDPSDLALPREDSAAAVGMGSPGGSGVSSRVMSRSSSGIGSSAAGLAAALRNFSRNTASMPAMWRRSAHLPSSRTAGIVYSVEANSPAFLSNR